jgi:23S rRNA-/tRNA-specific pseudouridylate synthase
VNLVHRLDRGASGCLLMTKTASEEATRATAILQEAMASNTSQKTYIALVRGEGIFRGLDLRKKGWFTVDRPIKDESGKLNNATTHFRFLAGQDNGAGTIDRPRASLVLARPETGRWHQIRRHLNGLSHPILGDTTHGDNQVNRSWRTERAMLPERTCLHLAKLEIPACQVCPQGISVSIPLAPDMMAMLENHLPSVLQEARTALVEEGIDLWGEPDSILEVPIEILVDR